MKKLIAVLILIVSYPLTAQISWSPYALVEENVHLGDIRPSYNYANLNVLAANAGIRVGAFISSPTALSGELTLGVVGLGSPGTFATNMIPVEVVGHLNTLQLSKTDIRFNLDFGAGIALAENSSTYYNLNRNAVLGLSLEFPRISKFESLILGVRYVSNGVDFLDKSVSGSDNDATLRFYTAVRFYGRSKSDTKNIDDINKLLLSGSQIAIGLIEKEYKNNASDKYHQYVFEDGDATYYIDDNGYFVKRENKSRGATALTTDDFATAEGSTYPVVATSWQSAV